MKDSIDGKLVVVLSRKASIRSHEGLHTEVLQSGDGEQGNQERLWWIIIYDFGLILQFDATSPCARFQLNGVYSYQ